MNLLSFLRRRGWFLRRKRDEDIVEAEAENAMRDNEAAHAEMKRIYELESSRSSGKLKSSIDKTVAPFADLEEMMQQDLQGRGRKAWIT